MYTLQDGLGSVRAEIAADTDITARVAYEPYGVPMNVEGIYSQPFRFTGEMLDTNTLQYHRARYYNAGMSGWASLDPFEGMADRAMSLNGYSWVEGNVVNRVDPSGLCGIQIGACIASLLFVVDNMALVGFATDFAACSWAASCVGAAALITQVSAILGASAANALAQLLGEDVASPNTGVVSEGAFTGNLNEFTTTWKPNPVPKPTPEFQPFFCTPCLDPIKPKEDDNNNCDYNRSPQEAARSYASTAEAYYQMVKSSISAAPPITVAVTRAKNIFTNKCNEVVAINNHIEGQQFREGLWRSSILPLQSMSLVRLADFVAGDFQPHREQNMGEHAEFNLINAIQQNYDISSFRAMGLNKKPCASEDYNCSLRLNNYKVMHPLAISFVNYIPGMPNSIADF